MRLAGVVQVNATHTADDVWLRVQGPRVMALRSYSAQG